MLNKWLRPCTQTDTRKSIIFYYIVIFNENDIYLIDQMYMGMEKLHHIQHSGRKTAQWRKQQTINRVSFQFFTS